MRKFIESFYDFSGRLNRKAYFIKLIGFYLIVFLLGFAAIRLLMFLAGDPAPGAVIPAENFPVNPQLFFLAWLVFIIFVNICVLSLQVRRLHDMNKSGTWAVGVLLLTFLVGLLLDQNIAAVITTLFSLILFLCKGTEGENKYGQDPLALKADEILVE